MIQAAADATGLAMTLVSAGDTLRTVWANEAAARVFGRGAAQLVALDPLSLFPDGEVARVAPVVAAFLARGELPSTFETSVIRGDGGRVDVDVGVGATTFAGRLAALNFFVDHGAQRHAREALDLAQLRYRRAVERFPDAIFLTRGDTVEFGNPSFEALVGRRPPASEPPGFDAPAPRPSLPPESPPHGRPLPAQRGARPAPARDTEQDPALRLDALFSASDGAQFLTFARDPDGQPRRFQVERQTEHDGEHVVELTALGLETGPPSLVLWIGRDVTAERRLAARVAQADRLTLLGTLASGMAHAINDPLSYTLLNLEHVARRLRSLGEGHEFYGEARVRLTEALDGAERVARVVRQMRSLSRPQLLRRRPIDVRVVLDNVLAMIGHELRHRARLRVTVTDAPRVVSGEGELEQALLGVLLAASRRHPVGSMGHRALELTVAAEGETHVAITVRDAPLEPGAATLGERPAEALPAPGGRDVALELARSAMATLGGELIVEGEGGEQRAFRLRVPVADDLDAPPSGPRSSRNPGAGPDSPPRRARVLVIDDDPGVASAFRAMLEGTHEVTAVDDPRAGLRLLLSDRAFDVVFCDLMMPELGGVDIYCALELNRPDRLGSVVFMTGGAFAEDAAELLGRVPNPRLEKPFHLARVEAVIAAMTARRAEG